MLSKSKFAIIAIVATLAIVTAYFSVQFIEQNKKNSPEYALEKVVKSIQKNDLKTFTRYVDTKALSESILKEFLEEPQAKPAEKDSSLWGNIKGFGKTIQNRLSGYIKPELINSIESQIQTYISTGYFTPQKDITSFYTEKPILEKLWLDLSGDSFSFLGLNNITQTKEKASAEVLFKRIDLNFSSSLTFHLKQNDKKWKIVSIDNLGETLNQLEELKVKKIKAQNKAIVEKIQKSINIQNIEKSEGLTKGEFGEMRILLRIAFENTAAKDIDQFKAEIIFKTKEGKVLRIVQIKDSDTIPSGGITEKSWPMTLSPLSKDDHTIFKAKKPDIDIQVIFKEVKFVDGETLKKIPLES